MTLAELKKILDATGFPVAYSHFTATSNKPVPSPPFICYLTPYSPNFIADNKVYVPVNEVQVELYTAKKDLAAEAQVEQALNNHDLPYDKSETYIDTENVFQILYEITI